ncbi:DNA-binding protein [Klebsiella pneumoniae]|nr:DNA-binding protein [Klebsiella pneumoniae]MBX4564722.1 DNA-binding protein [Klebsiella pneumoniae]SWD84041.1 DNA-binding protein [Klebsiella pneumoniae]VUG73321.1 DNA-binding protein [Klebsiella pneumoniae]
MKQDLQAVPEAFHYRLANRIRRVDATGLTAAPYQQIAREIKPARERLRQALNAGLPVTALDALFWFGSQRVAADIAQLRRSGMAIVTTEVEVSDNLFNTTRRVPVYRLASE